MNLRAAHAGAILLAASVITLAGCATGRFVRPTGASVPFPEAIDIWSDLTRPCRDVTAYRAQLRVSGRLHGQRVPGLTTGAAGDADRLAIAASHGATRAFHVAGRAAEVTLLLPLDERVVRGPAADVVDALVGVRLDPAGLLAVLTGCVAAGADVANAERLGAFARLTTSDGTVYLRQRGSEWQIAAAEMGAMTIDYRRLDAGWPREIAITRAPDVALTLEVVEFERNPRLSSALFDVVVPASFAETPIDALREDGAFGRRRD